MLSEVKDWPAYLDSPKPSDEVKSNQDKELIKKLTDIITEQSAEINRYRDAISKIKDIINTI